MLFVSFPYSFLRELTTTIGPPVSAAMRVPLLLPSCAGGKDYPYIFRLLYHATSNYVSSVVPPHPQYVISGLPGGPDPQNYVCSIK